MTAPSLANLTNLVAPAIMSLRRIESHRAFYWLVIHVKIKTGGIYGSDKKRDCSSGTAGGGALCIVREERAC
jgi:hypothetical protein